MPDRSSDSKHRPISLGVIETVGDATDRSFEEIPPLVNSIDPDALNALFDPTGPTPVGTGICLVFRFAGCRVQVRGDGTVSAVTSEFVSGMEGASNDRGERLSNGPNPPAESDTN